MRPAQFTATNGIPRRVECTWIWRAKRSLPTPLSPVIRTLPSQVAIRAAVAMSSAIFAFAAANEGTSAVVGRMIVLMPIGASSRPAECHVQKGAVSKESGEKSVPRRVVSAILVSR